MRSNWNSTIVAMHAAVRRAPLFAALLWGFLATGSSAMAQTLDDFRRAAAGDGVNVIPFESLRREATSVADEVERRKHEATQWNYSTYETMKQNLLKKRAAKQEEITAKEDEIEELKQLENADVSSYEEELEELQDELEELDDEIEELNEELEEGAEAWQRLWNARGGLRELFDDAKSEVRSAMSSPEKYLGSEATDEDIETLKDYLEVIEDEIELGEENHRIQEEGAKNTEQKFRNLIAVTE